MQRKRWSDWEDKRLIDLVVGQRVPIEDVARLLGRSVSATKARSARLKNEKKTRRDTTQ